MFVNYDMVREAVQAEVKNLAVFLSQVTEAFRKDTHIDLESTEGKTYWPCILAPRLLLISRENLKSLRLVLKTHYQPWYRMPSITIN